MLRFIISLFYLIYKLFQAYPTLLKVRKLNMNLPVAERDNIIHIEPKKWGRGMVRFSGSKIHMKQLAEFPKGPVLFISNHEGTFDIPILLGYLEKPFGFIAKIEVKKFPIIRSWMDVMGCVFIDRENFREAYKSLGNGEKLLKEGHSILIFPDGTRSLDGEMKSFKKGAFYLAKNTKVPIVPISIKGTYAMFEKNGIRIRPGNVEILIGEAIHPESYETMSEEQLRDRVEEIIRKQRQETISL